MINATGLTSNQDTFLLEEFGAYRWFTSTDYLIIHSSNIKIFHHNNAY